MSIAYKTHIDLGKNEIQNPRAQNLSTAPSSPVTGQFYYDTDDNVILFWNGSTWVSTSGGGITALTGDVSASGSGSVAATVNTVGGASAANIADAVTKRHTQNTDTGTTSATFGLLTGSSGAAIKSNSAVLEARNAADNAYANFKAADGEFTGNLVVTGNLTVSGTTTTLNVTTVETGDNIILLNSEISTQAGNTTAGIAVKRLDSDNSTRRDVQLVYDDTNERWFATFGDEESAPVSKQVVQKHSETIGDNSSTSIAVTHSLGTKDVTCEVYRVASPYDTVFCDVERNSTSQVTFKFAVAPATNEFRVVITG